MYLILKKKKKIEKFELKNIYINILFIYYN